MNYPTPQYPGYPPQGSPPQPAPQQYPPQAYPPQAPAYPAQPGYPPQQAYPQPEQPPAPQLAAGTLDAFYNQPSVGGGPSISWTEKPERGGQPKPIGTSYAGIVARDVTNADVQQQTEMKTNRPLFYRDGRPKFAMKVPLKVQPSEEFPEGEASWFVKGQSRDELVRAMAESGCEGSPKAGALIVVTLVQRRPSGAGMNPANIVQVQYTPPGGQPGQPAPAPQATTAPVAEAPSPAAAPVAQQPVQQYQQPVPQAAPPAPAPAPAPQQAAAPAPAGPAMPAGLDAAQQALLAQITGGAQQ